VGKSVLLSYFFPFVDRSTPLLSHSASETLQFARRFAICDNLLQFEDICNKVAKSRK